MPSPTRWGSHRRGVDYCVDPRAGRGSIDWHVSRGGPGQHRTGWCLPERAAIVLRGDMICSVDTLRRVELLVP